MVVDERLIKPKLEKIAREIGQLFNLDEDFEFTFPFLTLPETKEEAESRKARWNSFTISFEEPRVEESLRDLQSVSHWGMFNTNAPDT